MIYSSFEITNNTSIEKKYDLSPRKRFSFSLPLVIRVHIFLTCRLFEVVNKWGPIKDICFFPFSFFFFLHLVYFFLMDREVRTNWSNWRDVQPFFLPRSIFNACCIERSNPLKYFRTFNNFLEAHVNIIWSKRVHLFFALDITYIWSSH